MKLKETFTYFVTVEILKLVPGYIARAWKYIAVGTGLILFYLLFVVHVEPYEIGVSWNPFSGNLDTVESGIHVMAPWKMVSVIDLRPVRVGITSTARINNYKLVQFNKKGWREFVQIQGFSYWWWNNRFSFNFGYSEEYKGMKDIMRGYAYGNKKYSFITVLVDYSQNVTVTYHRHVPHKTWRRLHDIAFHS